MALLSFKKTFSLGSNKSNHSNNSKGKKNTTNVSLLDGSKNKNTNNNGKRNKKGRSMSLPYHRASSTSHTSTTNPNSETDNTNNNNNRPSLFPANVPVNISVGKSSRGGDLFRAAAMSATKSSGNGNPKAGQPQQQWSCYSLSPYLFDETDNEFHAYDVNQEIHDKNKNKNNQEELLVEVDDEEDLTVTDHGNGLDHLGDDDTIDKLLLEHVEEGEEEEDEDEHPFFAENKLPLPTSLTSTSVHSQNRNQNQKVVLQESLPLRKTTSGHDRSSSTTRPNHAAAGVSETLAAATFTKQPPMTTTTHRTTTTPITSRDSSSSRSDDPLGTWSTHTTATHTTTTVEDIPNGDPLYATCDHTRYLVKRYISIWNHHNQLDSIPEVCAPNIRFNGSQNALDRVGHAGLRRMVQTVHATLSDYHCEIHSMVVEGNKAFVRLQFVGRHTSALMGFPPTGQVVSWSGATEFTCLNGKIAKVWELGDMKSLEDQLQHQCQQAALEDELRRGRQSQQADEGYYYNDDDYHYQERRRSMY